MRSVVTCCCLAAAVWGLIGPTVSSADEMILNMGSARFGDVRRRAEQILAESGSGLGHNSATDVDQDYHSFTANFTAASDDTRMASFSDDQVTVFITDTTTGVESSGLGGQVGQGVALPNLNRSLVELGYSFTAGRSYSIRIEFKNILYTGSGDVDGVVLFAYSGGGSSTGSLSIRGIDTDTGREFYDGDCLHYNWGRRIRFTASGYSGTGDNLEWQTTSGGYFSTGSPVGPSVLWIQTDEWVSNVDNDVVVSVTQPPPVVVAGAVRPAASLSTATTAAIHLTIFWLNAAQPKFMFIDSNKTFIEMDAALVPPGRIEQKARELVQLNGAISPPAPVGRLGFVYVASATQAPIVGVGKLVEVGTSVNNSQAGAADLFIRIETGSTPLADANFVWTLFTPGGGQAVSHQFAVEVRGKNAFGNVRFYHAGNAPVAAKSWKPVAKFTEFPADVRIGQILEGGGFKVWWQPQWYIDTTAVSADPAVQDAKAQEYEAGFLQNVMETNWRAEYSDGSAVENRVSPVPIRDGQGRQFPNEDADFWKNPGAISTFPGNRQPVTLPQDDNIGWTIKKSLGGWTAGNGLPKTSSATLVKVSMSTTFRTWYSVRHKPTKELQSLQHCDWKVIDLVLWGKTLTFPKNHFYLKQTEINVIANGNGSPAPVLGELVAKDVQWPTYVPPAPK